MPSIPCPHCGAGLNVPETAIGKQGRCPKCQERFVLQLPKAVGDYDLKPVDATQLLPSDIIPLTPARTATASAAVALKAAPSKTRVKDDEPEKRPLPVWVV